jgi:hypothetical protein
MRIMELLQMRTLGSGELLAVDGGLMTALAWAILLGVATVLEWASPGLDVAVAVGMVAASAFGPLVAWRLHRRRVDWLATAGAFVGSVVGGVLLAGAVMLTAVLAETAASVGLFADATTARTAVDMAAAVALAVVFLGLAARADAQALADLRANGRERPRLDVARLLATLAYAACCAGVLFRAIVSPDPDPAGVFLLLVGPAVLGATAVVVADLMVMHGAPRARGRLELTP